MLTEGETILREVGRYTPEIGRRIREACGIGAARPGRRRRATADAAQAARRSCMPAFVKAHGHDHEQPLIGIAKDEPLTAWLDHAVNPFTGFMNTQRERLTRELGASPHLVTYRMARLCDIHYGITTSMVHHCNFNKYHVREIAQANEAAGTTMIVAIGGQDRNYVAGGARPAGGGARAARRRARDPGPARAPRFCPGPTSSSRTAARCWCRSRRWAREHGTLFHIHSAEEPRTTRWFTRGDRAGPERGRVRRVASASSTATRCSRTRSTAGRATSRSWRAPARKVVHNPLANTILGSGMPPVMEMLAAGVPVAISTDGSGSADNQNILAAARLAAQYQKALHQDATLLPSQQLLEMITSVPGADPAAGPGRAGAGAPGGLDPARPRPAQPDADAARQRDGEPHLGGRRQRGGHGGRARARCSSRTARVLPFADGTTPAAIMAAAQWLSELFAEYRRTAPELRGTGAHR